MSESIAQPTEQLRLPQRSQIFKVPDCQAGATFQSCYNKLDKFKVALLLKSLHPLLFGFGLMAWLLFVASRHPGESEAGSNFFSNLRNHSERSRQHKVAVGGLEKKIRILNLNRCSFVIIGRLTVWQFSTLAKQLSLVVLFFNKKTYNTTIKYL